MVGCNEKISPELQNAGTVGTPGGSGSTPVAPSTYYFSVTNTSAPGLNYNIHKTGAGNSKTPCEIKNTTGFESDLFRGANADYDISCYFEAEELSLYHQGMNFAVNASQNTCDFVGYTPFSFYESRPGDSTGTFTQVKCTNDTTGPANVVAADAANTSVDLTHATGTATCNQFVSHDIPMGTRRAFTVEKDEDLCRFNYEVEGKESLKCDIGEITINAFEVTWTPDENGGGTLAHKVTQRKHKCGGQVGNCARGPIEFIAKGKPQFTEISQQELNKPLTVEYKLPGLIGEYTSTRRYANFRRNLAAKEIDFVNSLSTPAPSYEAYKDTFSHPVVGKDFSPSVIDFYANNKYLDGTPIIDSTYLDAYSYPNNEYKAVPLAADPFMGISRDGEANEVNPFYTFYCFDDAFDIKARIRMVVRDWDRVFPSTTTNNEYISDIFLDGNSRQDNRYYVELPNDNGGYIYFNDRHDWDDLIPMRRTVGGFSASSTLWQPAAAVGFLDGFFNPNIFINQRDRELK